MNWSGPNCDFLPKLITFGPDHFILVVTISFWLWPFHYCKVQINLLRPKPFWTDLICFGHIEGQGIRHPILFLFLFYSNLDLVTNKQKYHANCFQFLTPNILFMCIHRVNWHRLPILPLKFQFTLDANWHPLNSWSLTLCFIFSR